MFKIGDFSKLTQVSIRMLRYYDETGLLKPAHIDKFTNYRLYSANQILKLNKIVALRDMGFLTSEIKEILDTWNEDTLLEKLNYKRQEVIENINCESKKLSKIENIIKNIRLESLNMNYEVNIKSIPSYNVVSLREIIPSYSDEGILWSKLCEFMEKENLKPLKEDVSFAMYHDKGYKENNVDVEIVTAINETGVNKNGFTFKKTEAIEQAACIMVPGPYENLTGAYQFLCTWIEQNNYEIIGINRQVCIKGHWNETNPQNYLNEIQMPVKKISR